MNQETRMLPGAFIFTGKWLAKVNALRETGMGYTVVDINLQDGRKFKQAVIDSGCLARIRGLAEIPFAETEIDDIIPTHQKWDWNE